MTIGERIEIFLEQNTTRFASKSELARALGTTYKQLQRYITNESKPKAEILEKFSLLGCDINWLITGKSHKEMLEIIELGEKAIASVDDIYKGLKKTNPDKIDKIEVLEAQLQNFHKILEEVKKKANK